MPAPAELFAAVLDCKDPVALAEFYRKVTGWRVTYIDDVYIYIGDGGPVKLGFQRVDGYQPPGWPDPAKHGHFDFRVADVAAAADELVALGATRTDHQTGGDKWLVLLDPEGHPFCITADA